MATFCIVPSRLYQDTKKGRKTAFLWLGFETLTILEDLLANPYIDLIITPIQDYVNRNITLTNWTYILYAIYK